MQGRPPTIMEAIKIIMVLHDGLLDPVRMVSQSGAVVVSIALDGGNTQAGSDAAILNDRNRALVAEVFPTDEERTVWELFFLCLEKAGVGDALENAFAVLVAGSCVAKGESLLITVNVSIRFIDDDGGSMLPGG